MTFVPLGMDDELYDELMLYRQQPDRTRIVRKINARPLRQDDLLRRLQWRGWLQWLKTVPVTPGNERTAREIDVYYRLTDGGEAAMDNYEMGFGGLIVLNDGAVRLNGYTITLGG